MKSCAALAFLSILPLAEARNFTVRNACSFTIWPAIFTDLNVGTAVPSIETGWEAPPNTSRSFEVPDNWTAGRIWVGTYGSKASNAANHERKQGRSDCNFSVNPGPNSCLTGGCNGGLLCDNTTGTGVPPATLAEWTLSGDGNRDFYDVSLVDGYNLPMAITTNSDCPIADCPADLASNCPAALTAKNSAGASVGCKTACFANLDGNQANSPNCCSGQFSTPETCPPSGIQFYDHFKQGCPNSYAYAYDESSNTALWTCDSIRKVDYTLTFCPS
ncbi:thaumatin-like protein [Rhizoctonia solani]|uniref:Thaumatin-like protein n=1 Tax=Rhizoctonia solani TaxID=456999 RepID=A0A8H7H3P8_9AGAM|nr:thaumatin-like protein [Rhizoctonia solani]